MLAVGSVSCSDDNDCLVEKDKYVYDIPQTHVDDAVIGAYYTNITSASSMWTKGHSGTSVLGEYLSTDPEVIKQQLKWCDEAGVNFLIFTADEFTKSIPVLINNFISARNEIGADVGFVIDYNVSHLKCSATATLTSDDKMAALISDFTDYLAQFMAMDSYYRLPDGSPVVLMTKINQSTDLWPAFNFAQALPPLREAMAQAGEENMYIIGEVTTGWCVPTNYDDYIWSGFDGVTPYDWSTNMYDRNLYFHSFMDVNWQRWNEIFAPYGIDFVPCIHPSYNDRANSTSSYKYIFGQDGDTGHFINSCNVAKRNVGSQKVILINSWNNFLKGWAMEPTEENHGNFIKECYQQFRVI